MGDSIVLRCWCTLEVAFVFNVGGMNVRDQAMLIQIVLHAVQSFQCTETPILRERGSLIQGVVIVVHMRCILEVKGGSKSVSVKLDV